MHVHRARLHSTGVDAPHALQELLARHRAPGAARQVGQDLRLALGEQVARALGPDDLPALALVMDPPEADTLARPPRPPKEAMLGRPEWRRIVLTAVVEAAVVLAVYRWALGRADGGVDEARSVVFSTIVFCEVLRAFGARSLTRIFWETGVLSNLLLLGVVAVTLGIQLALHAVPATQAFLRIDELPLADWALAIGAGLVPVTAVEVSKLLGRLRRRPA